MAQPIVFLAHGTPMNALINTQFSHDWKSFLENYSHPRAIMCMSAHWLTRGTFVTVNDAPETIHDFHGFPAELYKIQYRCSGYPDLAAHISHQSGGKIDTTHRWGLDHGCWSLLRHLYPEADVPTMQISINQDFSPLEIYELGVSLQYLRDEGVLLIGSGNIVHNIQKWRAQHVGNLDWAREFDQAIASALLKNDVDTILNYTALPHAAEAVPTPEHFLPLVFILGLRRESDKLEMTHYPDDDLESICMRSLAFR